MERIYFRLILENLGFPQYLRIFVKPSCAMLFPRYPADRAFRDLSNGVCLSFGVHNWANRDGFYEKCIDFAGFFGGISSFLWNQFSWWSWSGAHWIEDIEIYLE